MKKIAIYGAGGFGREVKMLIDQINHYNLAWDFIGYFDDDQQYQGKRINDSQVFSGIDNLNKIEEPTSLILAIGDPKIKKVLVEKIRNEKISFPVLIHPNVLLGDKQYVDLGEGTIVTAGNIITVNIKIGKHVMVNLDCTIGHDVVIGDFCSLMPSVNLSGDVTLEEGVYIGTGTQIINKLKIGKYSIIGAGAVVIRDIPSGCTAVGVPAMPIKFHE